MKKRITELCKKCGADLVGFAPIERFPKDSAVHKLMPEAKTVIGLGFRVLRGAYRGIEEGSTYYQYSSMGVATMEDNIIPTALFRLSMLLEDEGYLALPQQRQQKIMAEENSTNPEVSFDSISRNRPQETQMNFSEAAVLCGLGEIGLHGALLTDEFGPFVRIGFVLTDAIIEASPVKEPHLCDKCGECVKGCPGHAIDKDGTVDKWQCAVYYSGACGLKNPFMPPFAYSDLEDRIDIISGEAKVTPETARVILRQTNFYPSVGSYRGSICGRACDINCYIHLEKKGVLAKNFNAPFRKRDEWKFKIEDFELKV